MKRPIKFRGRDIETGEFVYGLLTKKKIRSSGEVVYAIAQSEKQSETIPVNETSIAQLVGYDKDGREVYEGDVVVGEYGDEVVARLMDNLPPKPKLKEVIK